MGNIRSLSHRKIGKGNTKEEKNPAKVFDGVVAADGERRPHRETVNPRSREGIIWEEVAGQIPKVDCTETGKRPQWDEDVQGRKEIQSSV